MDSKNIRMVLEILKNEVDGDVDAALRKMADDYSMTWIEQGIDRKAFRRSAPDFSRAMRENIYPIRGRKYVIKNIAENEGVVMIEVIESYPDPETGREYRTPQVIVLELDKIGKIRTGRHYTDPRLPFLRLTEEEVEEIFINHNSEKDIVIE